MNRKLNLSVIFIDDNDFKLTIKKAKELLSNLTNFKSNLNNKDALELFVQRYSYLYSLLEMLSVYTSYKKLMDINDDNIDSAIEVIDNLYDESDDKLNFFFEELSNIKYDQLLEYISSSAILRNNKKFLIDSLALSKHNVNTLKQEHSIKIIKDSYRDIVSSYKTGEIDETSEVSRKQAYDDKNKFYIDNKDRLSICFIDFIKEVKEMSITKNYESPLQYLLSNDNISPEIFNTFMNSVKNNADIFRSYLNYHQSIFNNNYFDIKRDIGSNTIIPFEEGYNHLTDSLSLLGNTYQNKVKEYFNSGLIDTLPNSNKARKDTSSPIYLKDSLSLICYENDIYLLSAMAHEIGHVMNDKYSKVNSYLESSSNTLVTETIAIVNQMILHNHLLEKMIDNKTDLDNFYLDNIIFPLFNHSLNEEFKVRCFDLSDLSEESLSQLYLNLKKQYYGEFVYSDDEKNDYLKNDRFFSYMYNYQYSFGYVLSHIIYNRLVNDKNYVDKYLKFISMGSSVDTVELFKMIDIDLNDANTYNMGFNLIRNKLINQKERVS